MDLNAVWFVLLGVLLGGYAVLDGFDLGVGILHPLARNDRERRMLISSIGPIWDGNEVWLVTFGGALFAAFPEAYATGLSALYVPFMALLAALIFRAVSIEFRSKLESKLWRRAWDIGFFGSSLSASFLFGLAVGNSIIGMRLDERGVFIGSFRDFLNPYALLIGALTVAMFAMHGASYLRLKIGDPGLLRRNREWVWTSWGAFLVLYLLATIYTLMALPGAAANFKRFPLAFGFVVIAVLAIANIPRSLYRGAAVQTFASSAATVAALVGLLGVAMWPNLVAASNDPALSLTAYNAASSPTTLRLMFILALVGMPFVIGYTAVVYWTFRGRVGDDSVY